MTSNYRPIFHFSPPRGWINDPNGLVWHNDLWHLFYQHSPTQTVWGPMHWGHAVSRDLTHWEHCPIALYPDALGAIWSGSAALNEQDERGELVACFTHEDGSSQSQSLAFSRDDGQSWEKYEHNPVLKLERRDFRDPKIFRFNEQWHMIVAAGIEAQIYLSPNLTDWTLLSSLPLDKMLSSPGVPTDGWLWECPDLFEMDGRWILIASFYRPDADFTGSGTYFWVGDFDGEAFTTDGQAHPLSFGPDDYAAVSWSDAPENRKLIIGWMNRWLYADKTPTGDECWRGAMTLPRELSFQDGILRQNPPQELASRHATPILFDETPIAFAGEAYEIEAEIHLAESQANQVGFRLRVGQDEATRVFYDVEQQELCIDRTQSGQVDFHAGFSGTWHAPLAFQNGILKLRIFVDRCSVEVFAQDGALYGAAQIFPAPDSRGIAFFGEGARVERGAIYPYLEE